jgi:dTDP-4-amino-4,6-dideoxygalactose transaminase/predicted dehydrogenase
LKSQLKGTVLDVLCERLMASAHGSGRRPFGAAELKLVREALVSQNLCCIDGHMVTSFEKQFAYNYGVPYAVASTSGTAAIHVALGALDLNPGDEVITAPITDMGTIIPILYQGAVPVFADVDRAFNMDPAAVERCITPRTRAIIAVHLFGNPCDMDAMLAVARAHRLPLIEDCSQAHLAEYRGRLVGTIGDIGCFSFQASKQMTTGDGGMTITSNKAYYERMKLFADKGYARKGWGARSYLFHAPNYRMTELVGAVGLAQLEKLKAVIEKRREVGDYFGSLVSRIDGVEPAPLTPGATHSYWCYPLVVNRGTAEDFAAGMRAQKVWVSAGYTGKPIYLCSDSLTAKKTYGDSQWPFTSNPGVTYEYTEGLCPIAEERLTKLVCIPFDESKSREDMQRVAAAIERTLAATAAPAASQGTTAPIVVKSAPTQKLRVGIVGCGQMGRWHLDAYRRNPHVEVVACVDTSAERAEAFAREVGGVAYRSHRELLDSGSVDAASLCTVPTTHRDIAVDLLKGGVHVLCEKPLAISVAQAEEMSATAKASGRLLFTAFKFRFHDEVRRARDLVQAGSLGDILNFRLMFGDYVDMAGTWYAQKALAGGGIIMDNGPHAADLVHFLLGPVKEVTAEASSVQHLEVEDTAKLSMSLDNGKTVGTTDLSWSVRVPCRSYLELYGVDGAALLDPDGLSYRFKSWKEWKRVDNAADRKQAFARQIDYFVGAVRGENPLSLGNGEGVMSQRVIEAAYRSVQERQKIAVKSAKG